MAQIIALQANIPIARSGLHEIMRLMYWFFSTEAHFFYHSDARILLNGGSMGFIQLLLIGVGLSMDAFAVSVCKGLKMKTVDKKYTMLVAAFFGGFQALMPLLGWLLGKQFEQYITNYDHWIAFVLLGFVGGKMILEAIQPQQPEENCEICAIAYDIKDILVLAIATSIDALAVGITFAFLNVNIWIAVIVIGVTTFLLSIVGVFIGNHFGIKYKSKAELIGGIVLVLIGLKILLEHLNILM